MRKTVFIKNALILTATSFLLRFAGIIFKVWLAKAIGSEGIGLHSQIFSFYILCSTFATTGIVTAITRLISEELALGSKKGTIKILRRSVELSLILSLITILIIFFSADFIAENLLEDKRAIIAIKILPFSLPFMSVSSCFKGYFIARRKIYPNSLSQIAEQIVRILIVVFLVSKFIKMGLAITCAAVILGDIISEFIGFLFLLISYISDKTNLNYLQGRNRPPFPIVKRILEISVPITSGRYLNSLLRTAENILVPKNLEKFPLLSGNALSLFGMIKGMALPILFFPSAILNSLSTLLIPEISEASALKRMWVIKESTEKIIKLTAIISFIVASVFYVSGERLGILIYKSEDVGFLIKYLSPIVPLMYLDSISDGILKGLDQQKFTFKTAISDSIIRIILIITLLKYSGIKGFIGIMYFSNFLTCFLNVGRLIKVSGAEIKKAEEILLPLISAITVSLLLNTIFINLNISDNLVYIILLSLFSIALYTLLLFSFKIINKEELSTFLG